MAIDVQLFLDLATIVISLVGSAFLSGARWGRIETKTTAIESRLARIEGMFVLSLRDDREHRERGLS